MGSKSLLVSFFLAFVVATMAIPVPVTLEDVLDPSYKAPSPSKVSSKAPKRSLQVGFYDPTCPFAEQIVESVVNKAISRDKGIAGGLIRMHFHDCFVRGCDGSVLLKGQNGNPAERDHPANNPSLRGFEVIDQAKAILERVCPKTVSCADVLALAARDSAYRVGRIHYEVPSGRRDGRVSNINEVSQNLPPPSFNADQLIANFKRKGFSADEMVTLSGAHSIGVSRCSSFSNRLYSFNGTVSQDPSLDPTYAAELKKKCPVGATAPTVPLDKVTPNALDNKYYVELKNHRGLLTSDQTLFTSSKTSRMVLKNAKYGSAWGTKYAKAMIKMGKIDLLTGKKGEIRTVCSKPN